MKKALVLALLLSSPAIAEDKFVPIDEKAFNDALGAFSQVSMPLLSHQQIQAIMKSAEQASVIRDTEAKAKAGAEHKEGK